MNRSQGDQSRAEGEVGGDSLEWINGKNSHDGESFTDQSFTDQAPHDHVALIVESNVPPETIAAGWILKQMMHKIRILIIPIATFVNVHLSKRILLRSS